MVSSLGMVCYELIEEGKKKGLSVVIITDRIGLCVLQGNWNEMSHEYQCLNSKCNVN